MKNYQKEFLNEMMQTIKEDLSLIKIKNDEISKDDLYHARSACEKMKFLKEYLNEIID